MGDREKERVIESEREREEGREKGRKGRGRVLPWLRARVAWL